MTYSVVALSGDGARLGVATASRSLAVGAAVPALAPQVGALVTQAYTNQRFRSLGLQLLRDGLDPQQVINRLAREDDDFDRRQVGIVDAAGHTAVWTGAGCTPWAGAVQGPGFVVLGNLLAGPAVLDEMHRVLTDTSEETFSARLLVALEAAQAAGGDARGQQSAALRVVNNAFEDVSPSLTEVDLRVDDDQQPLRLLRRMLATLPTAADDASAELTDPARSTPTMGGP
ncbi:DUF1028 domain-containing protein [Ornithinimicrobium cryptoxanthini]|uniref:DUF1028 domain-containing protein n=1 Tax=Ornithinimicrobium cryptoxanthini TaxID=2934161 RepID=A0ABY4YKX1_9MICO|nr:DUF1028 domain-containing protein [Ornithinimicrobium cryptoxanthini]USQ77379.1 DUF1028 domain-containing protein [Ornithinimicrobium cryptoxanthini]